MVFKGGELNMNRYKIAKLYSKMIDAEHWHQQLVDISNLANEALNDERLYIFIDGYRGQYGDCFLNNIKKFFPLTDQGYERDYYYKITWLGLWKLNHALDHAYKKQCKLEEKYYKMKGVTWNY